MTGAVVWITGLPQSGKSTLATRLFDSLDGAACVLDSDRVRAALVPTPGFDDTSRDQFYLTLANLAALLAAQGLVVIVPATANRRRFRDRARELAPAFVEVYVDAPAEECARRDQKGLYSAGPANLPGLGANYEPPADPDVTAPGGLDAGAVSAILRRLAKLG